MRVSAVPKTATKNPSGSATKLQLHISHQPDIVQERGHRVYDFTEFKLKKILSGLFSAEKRVQVADLLEKYKAGKAAVGWNRSAPVFIDVLKDK